VRRYSSEAPQKSSRAPIYGGIVLAAAGLGYWKGDQIISAVRGPAEPKERAKAFIGGDQGWIGLKLADVKDINHNVKRFRFEFPDPESVSGLHIACKSGSSCHSLLSADDPALAALLTKFQGPNDEKPTIRPYTPVTDERICPIPPS
jgi:cytochrome-b5 reductase